MLCNSQWESIRETIESEKWKFKNNEHLGCEVFGNVLVGSPIDKSINHNRKIIGMLRGAGD